MRRMRPALAIGMIATSLLALPSLAEAAQRYASPTGTGADPCAESDPCSLPDAVSGALLFDEVIVAPGDYPLTSTIDFNVAITLRGVPGQARPRLLFSGVGQSGVRADVGGTVRYLEIVQGQAGQAGYFSSGAAGDQLIIRGATNTLAEIQSASTLSNSIVVTSVGAAVTTSTNGGINTATYRNVTAISTAANGFGMRVSALGLTGVCTINAFNVIAKGGATGGDLRAQTDSSGATATINATNSNFATVSTSGTNTTLPTPGDLTNQNLAPVFVDAPAGDYHQAAGSPTIDAGSVLGTGGLLDVDGDPRSILTPDIGADEAYVAPSVTSDAATAVDHQAATLNGTVNPRGSATTYNFEYGPTTAYGDSTPSTSGGTGGTAEAVSAVLSGLLPLTTYHYRLVASNPGGSSFGSDQTFTTSAAPTTGGGTTTTQTTSTPTPTTTTPTPTPSTSNPLTTFAGVTPASTRLRYRGGRVPVTLRCPAGSGGCKGTLTLTARSGGSRSAGRAAATVVLGRAGFSAAAGRSAVVRVRITSKGKALLRRARRTRSTLRVVARNAAGQSKTTTRAVTIRR